MSLTCGAGDGVTGRVRQDPAQRLRGADQRLGASVLWSGENPGDRPAKNPEGIVHFGDLLGSAGSARTADEVLDTVRIVAESIDLDTKSVTPGPKP
jgi:hypothetical protein